MRTAAATALLIGATALIAPTGAGAGRARTSAAVAQAFADAVTLHPADLPEYPVSSEPARTKRAERQLEARLTGCVRSRTSRMALAQGESKEFARSGGLAEQSVSSHVEVLGSATAAKQLLARVRSPRTGRCLARYIAPLLHDQEHGGVKFHGFSVTRTARLPVRLKTSFGWRILASVSDRGLRAKVAIDIDGFAYGPAIVALFSLAVPAPFPAQTEGHLLALLEQRASAQST
jgi:hypothetical protein